MLPGLREVCWKSISSSGTQNPETGYFLYGHLPEVST